MFPKSRRLLRSSDFRRVRAQGFRVNGPYFSALCLEVAGAAGPRIGFTVPRSLGRAVVRNRLRRRVREAVRRQLHRLAAPWEIVIQPRRTALGAGFAELEREMERLFARCAG